MTTAPSTLIAAKNTWRARDAWLSAIVALLAAGCGRFDEPNPPAGLPRRYHNTQYDFMFFLPAGWQGYSVLIHQWDAPLRPVDHEKAVQTEHGQIIVLRNPQWRAGTPYQDIPIMVFTRSQWDALHTGKFFPYAGGVISEMCHDHKHVLGIYSRYNADDSVKGWKEAADIIARNSAAHTTPPLYPE